jgi:hypothetical protein
MLDEEDRVRTRAFLIWEREGCPEGLADAHWEMAQNEIAIESNQYLVVLPIRSPKGKSPRKARTARS